METEQLEKDLAEGEETAKPTAEESTPVKPLPDKEDQTDNKPGIKGSLKTKTYVLKKKSDKK